MPTLADFLARALPWPAPGQPGVASLHWRSWKGRQVTSSKPFTTLADMLSFIEWSWAPAMRTSASSTSARRSRKGPARSQRATTRADREPLKENILHSKALFADIDKGYETPGACAAAVVAMCEATAAQRRCACGFG